MGVGLAFNKRIVSRTARARKRYIQQEDCLAHSSRQKKGSRTRRREGCYQQALHSHRMVSFTTASAAAMDSCKSPCLERSFDLSASTPG